MHMGRTPYEDEGRDPDNVSTNQKGQNLSSKPQEVRWDAWNDSLSQLSGRSNSADILLSHSSPPELWGSTFLLFKPPSLSTLLGQHWRTNSGFNKGEHWPVLLRVLYNKFMKELMDATLFNIWHSDLEDNNQYLYISILMMNTTQTWGKEISMFLESILERKGNRMQILCTFVSWG